MSSRFWFFTSHFTSCHACHPGNVPPGSPCTSAGLAPPTATTSIFVVLKLTIDFPSAIVALAKTSAAVVTGVQEYTVFPSSFTSAFQSVISVEQALYDSTEPPPVSAASYVTVIVVICTVDALRVNVTFGAEPSQRASVKVPGVASILVALILFPVSSIFLMFAPPASISTEQPDARRNVIAPLVLQKRTGVSPLVATVIVTSS